MLASALENQLRRPVVNRTGLTGTFDFKLQWPPAVDLSPTPNAEAPDAAEASGPSIFTALEEQLGPRLESTRAEVDVLVIDHVERPSEN
jgi:uncharacterized protein (TIGR03435 family)